MSQQQNPLSRDDIFELFRQTNLQFKETDKKFEDIALSMK